MMLCARDSCAWQGVQVPEELQRSQPAGRSGRPLWKQPCTEEDIVLFAGPGLKPIAPVDPAPRIYLDRSFRQDPSVGVDFTLLSRDVEHIVRGMFGGASPPVSKPIICWVGAPLPLTDATTDRRFTFIRIALTDQDLKSRNYCRFAYQLAHELGHVYLDARRSNGLIETLADAISYQSLARLAELWEWERNEKQKSYAPLFLKYRDLKTAEKLKCLPSEFLAYVCSGRTDKIKDYLEQHVGELDETPNSPSGLAMRSAAAMIFPREIDWKPFVGIAALTDPSPSEDGRYRQGFPIEMQRLPRSVRTALRAIGRP